MSWPSCADVVYVVLQEASQMLSQAALKGELEAHQQQLEDYKVKHQPLLRHFLENSSMGLNPSGL